MLSVKQLLVAAGLRTQPDQIKLVRHSSHLGRSIRQIIADGVFEIYQAEQAPDTKPFHKCEVILSFIGIEGNQAVFHGAYEVVGSRPFQATDFDGMPDYLVRAHADGKPRIWYDLNELPEFRGFRNRLIVQWVSTRGWFQTKDLAVHELLPPGEEIPFPGYQDILLNWSQLKTIISNPRLHRDWKTALSASAGIYRIVDHDSGKIYIGAAYGIDGIWGRWSNYALTGHGGNKLLIGLDAHKFQWSIIRTLSGSMSAKEIIRIERIEMAKHGSKAIGLNSPDGPQLVQ
ncbi:GIY-YIG nuclease family protein [Luteolibacter sp. GHJ8]|uniref:GIY-YIG nuclease family protein n=1 Tax=Luteolibacter rhizosphaerae TaxID=2989719 RepID=A0ABT3G2C7_9BACT|nr:GIY-YIG nuclease family protein [Luteolibacter rhizosphaerae]MCW1913990.1 GIY-YIG nuclease family protein [Luteolibacter rhizosphaerae]